MVQELGSKPLFEKASKLMPGGVNSPVRMFKPYPFFTQKATGSKHYDVDGNSYIDYCMAYGAIIFGHSHPPIIQAVKKKLRQVIADEYSQDGVYDFSYKAGYQDDFRSFDGYLNHVAELVVTGAMNGANDMLEAVYRSLMHLSPLTPARRHPRRLKTW